MKREILFATFIMLPWFCMAQINEFVIGGDFLRHPPTLALYDTIQPVFWNNARDAGMRWVGVYVDTSLTDATQIMLNTAQRNNMKVVLGNAWTHSQPFESITRGHRWRFHPEFSGHYPDFQDRRGESVFDGISSQTDSAADMDADGYSYQLNSWQAVAGVHQAGMLCQNLNQTYETSENVTLNVRVRLRLDFPGSVGDTTSVIQVIVMQGSTEELNVVIRGNTLKRTPTLTVGSPGRILNSDRYYGEVYIGSFIKSGSAPVDYRIYWPGSASVHVDYIAVDDAVADTLFGGLFDLHIDQRWLAAGRNVR